MNGKQQDAKLWEQILAVHQDNDSKTSTALTLQRQIADARYNVLKAGLRLGELLNTEPAVEIDRSHADPLTEIVMHGVDYIDIHDALREIVYHVAENTPGMSLASAYGKVIETVPTVELSPDYSPESSELRAEERK